MDVDGRITFEWHTKTDEEAVKAMAERVYAELGNGTAMVEYNGKKGRLFHSEGFGYYFKKCRAKKFVTLLPLRQVCEVKRAESVKAA